MRAVHSTKIKFINLHFFDSKLIQLTIFLLFVKEEKPNVPCRGIDDPEKTKKKKLYTFEYLQFMVRIYKIEV